MSGGADGANIFSILPNGKGQKQLTKGPGFHLCPSFSADGRTIAYCSNVSGAWEIWTMRANGSKQRQLTHLNGFATFPDFSPDGKTIVFGGTEGADSSTRDLHRQREDRRRSARADELRRLRRRLLQRPAGLVAGRDEDRVHPCRRCTISIADARGQRTGLGDGRRRRQPASAHQRQRPARPGPRLEPRRLEDRVPRRRLRQRRDLGHGRRRWEQAPAQRLRRRCSVAVRPGR